ncbi:SAM-dependent methyltransferase [Catenulispora yoronensis]|uniref:SAM-dependent methyltransferase n=1 Tax=Catenulispora yoronensis TaxID=450799 RepID=A0ABN2TQP2_9ACTN
MAEELRSSLGREALAPQWDPPQVDTTRPHPARIYDYLLGGKDNFPADRAAAQVALRALPELRAMARANRAFLGRAVRFLARAGIDQFLDLGSGVPGPGHTAQVVRAVAPGARVVLVDYDPIVVAHSMALVDGGAGTGASASADGGSGVGRLAVVQADVRDPQELLDRVRVREVLDFRRPVAVLMVALLHFVAEDEDAPGIVARFVREVSAGSAVVISHATDGGQPERSQAARRGWDQAASRLVARSAGQIEGLFAGVEPVAPGVVPLPLWRPDGPVTDDVGMIWLNGGVGFKREA